MVPIEFHSMLHHPDVRSLDTLTYAIFFKSSQQVEIIKTSEHLKVQILTINGFEFMIFFVFADIVQCDI